MHFQRCASYITLAALHLATAAGLSTADCSSLAKSADLSSLNTTVLNSTHYEAGDLKGLVAVNDLPLCEVYASVRYGSGNDTLIFAIWLPDETQYSSRLMAVGNGGFAGAIPYDDMLTELNHKLGFAVVAGTGGHVGPGMGASGVYEPFLHSEDQLKAWMHNAISLLTPASKTLVKTYYGDEPKYSYFSGCSTGGGQGFSIAEFHPDLFDGVIAGCAANWYSHLLLAFLWSSQKTATPETNLPDATLDMIQASVIKECDLLDGVEDKLVENPLACKFDVSSLQCPKCPSKTNTTCLTAAQVEAVEALHQGPVRSDDPSVSLYPGLALASEAGWGLPQVQAVLSDAITVPILQNLVFNNLSYDASTFDYASDVERLDAAASHLIDAISTDLSPFRRAGGKMIVYHGWADPNISPLLSLEHVEAITRKTIGEGAGVADNDFLKLVMVPGGGHCGSNVAKYPYIPAQYGTSAAMVDWVEKGVEPVAGIKSWNPPNGDDRTRRLCTWPRVAKLTAGGNVDDWESYTCE